MCVAEKRIKKFIKSHEDQQEQLEFLYAEMKKRFDDLSLYNLGDDYYIKEMEVKLQRKEHWWEKVLLW